MSIVIGYYNGHSIICFPLNFECRRSLSETAVVILKDNCQYVFKASVTLNLDQQIPGQIYSMFWTSLRVCNGFVLRYPDVSSPSLIISFCFLGPTTTHSLWKPRPIFKLISNSSMCFIFLSKTPTSLWKRGAAFKGSGPPTWGSGMIMSRRCACHVRIPVRRSLCAICTEAIWTYMRLGAHSPYMLMQPSVAVKACMLM